MGYYIGLDIGTSALKGLLLSETGILKTVSFAYPVLYPGAYKVEQDPEEWYEKALLAIRELSLDIPSEEVEAIGFSGQMHGLVLLDEKDEVIRPAILWNDGRSTKETDYLNQDVGEDFLLRHTGNIAFPGFTAPKLLWVARNEPEHFSRIGKILLPKDYVAFRLSGQFATDVSDAAGTLYFDTAKRCWSEPMLSLLHIRESQLPKVYESNECIGTLREELAQSLSMPRTKIVIGAGDNAASAIGTGTLEEGQCNLSLGTSGTIFVVTETPCYKEDAAIHTFCSANRKYHYLACILSAASCQKWWIEDILRTNYDFSEAKKWIGRSRVLFLPYLTGERSPINDATIRGAFVGLSVETTREEMTIAVLEGVAFALRQNLDIIRSFGITLSSSTICGGGIQNKLWLPLLADILEVTLSVQKQAHGGVLGAALLAAQGCLLPEEYQKLERKLYAIKETIPPSLLHQAYYEEKYERFLKLYPALKSCKEVSP